MQIPREAVLETYVCFLFFSRLCTLNRGLFIHGRGLTQGYQYTPKQGPLHMREGKRDCVYLLCLHDEQAHLPWAVHGIIAAVMKCAC